MTDRPIIFSAPMVRAKRAGRKTQTRRLATSPLRRVEVGDRLWVRENFRLSPDACEGWPADTKPCRGWLDYAAGGHEEVNAPDFDAVLKVAGKDVDWDCLSDSWRPCIHMPRWASRFTLIVVDVRTQQLHDISEDDAWAEGVCHAIEDSRPGLAMGDIDDEMRRAIVTGYIGGGRRAFHWLWDQLHDKPGQRWEDNPPIVALSFRVVHGNIDQVAT